MGQFAEISKDPYQLIIVAKPSTLDICGTAGYISVK